MIVCEYALTDNWAAAAMEVASGLKLFAKNIVNIVIDSSVLWNLTREQ